MPVSYRQRSLLAIAVSLFSVSLTEAFVPLMSKGAVDSSLKMALSDREAEIRRKIAKLKRQGRFKKQRDEYDDDDDDDLEDVSVDYSSKVRQKLGDTKSKMLGFSTSDEMNDDDNPEEILDSDTLRKAQIGALPQEVQETDEVSSSGYQPPKNTPKSAQDAFIDPSLFGDDDEDDEEQPLSEEEFVDLVATKMAEKRQREQAEKERKLKEKGRARLQSLEEERQEQAGQKKKLTGGVGGSWSKNETAMSEDLYKPKTGSWGAFPRPRDISKAYGGGRRVGPGFSNEAAREKSEEETRARLQAYREKMGIEVASEKEHADEIQEALNIATLAMQRGVYSTAVSTLEKVTKFCSTNSKVGGNVFLELAMAYEAMGRTEEAIKVYRALTKCRIEDIKYNAKRLLYGIEAMQFMTKEMKNENFSRKRAKNVFIDTTGMANIAQNFDDVYETAYIDLKGNSYKRLTESVVRTSREARQIILRATGAGEVERLRVVQALRSLSRHFDDALQAEIERNTVEEPVAVMDGKPIIQKRLEEESLPELVGMDGFVLSDAQQMMENLNGEWRLQLLADKTGDGVKYFNSTISWQQLDMDSMMFSSKTPSAFVTVEQSGNVEFNEKRRILRRRQVEVSGGGVFASLVGMTSGAPGAVRTPQQVISVDSVLMVTRGVPSKRAKPQNRDSDKDYFAVWRRVEPGTYSVDRSM